MSGLYLPTRWLVPSGTVSTDANVFPLLPGQMFLTAKGPTWVTTVKKAASGRQVRGSLQAAPIWTFKVAYEFLTENPPTKVELETLWAFFNSRSAQFGSFFYLDPTDNTATAVQFGVGDGATTTFQLQRIQAASTPYAFSEPVYAVYGTPIVSVNGSATTAFTVNPYGTLTFNTAPAASAVLTWTGNFFFYCHFTQDDLSPQQMVQQLWSLEDGLTFESLLP